ncbi:conserved hypothetical protein [Verticillium alfalfae VaMs.102]|uniref:Uncharacterized protein n=1 Tax=Verticillium alfalfae (strain VaMs.102 / ATCC MYA-4576 / FGSC 10136) TaxID=526221 RepID=C9S5V8_VERA1|nr:conserved hypothetical protein [Verticillium alfalfae VaMs.102]EEY15097.1 conserved hypothetical protein [Verticillium alfalfae VaMs.102]
MSSPCEDATTDEPSYEIGSWSMGDDGFDLGVRMNGKRFRIAVWADYFKDSPSATAAFQKALAIMNDGDDSCEELWDYLEWIVDFFLPQFQSLAPPVVHAGILTLAHLAVRESFRMRVPFGSKGRLRGLIYHFIKSEERLTWAVDERAPLALREKWAAQIKDTVAKLHHLGVVWGDVKADNVLVDENSNAIVIDLEGGTTQGWVDRGKEGTVEGDAQRIENMMDFIFNDESMLRPPPLGPDDEPIVKLRGY